MNREIFDILLARTISMIYSGVNTTKKRQGQRQESLGRCSCKPLVVRAWQKPSAHGLGSGIRGCERAQIPRLGKFAGPTSIN